MHIILKPLQHRGNECIAIYYEKSPTINNALQKIAGARWSQSQKCWYTELSKEKYELIIRACNTYGSIDHSAIKQYLYSRRPAAASVSVGAKKIIIAKKQHLIASLSSPFVQIHPHNQQVLPQMKQHLLLKAYSLSTIKTYLNEMGQLLQILGKVKAESLQPHDLKRYLAYCYEQLGLSENTLHSRTNAMKFYYEQVLGRDKFFWAIPRPKKVYILPKVLGEAELKRLFTALKNKKHKAIIFTAYSAGLRVSEVVNLQLKHIDRSRMQMLIKNSKGKKDRYVMLSPVLLDVLTAYYTAAVPKPKKYVFESPIPGSPYSASSMQRIFQIARKEAGINKDISFHGLRHSFATHLLEKGVDIKYIKDLLGHFDIKTTTRYLHVKREQLVNIISPLDSIISKDEI